MKIVAISDTHELHEHIKLPEGDVLVHAGDFTNQGRIQSVYKFCNWMSKQNFQYKLVCAGNHDRCFANGARPEALKALEDAGVTYLEDSGIIIDGVNFWANPFTPTYGNWAFMLPRKSEALKATWDQVPIETNIILSHGPPQGILDWVPFKGSNPSNNAGCELALARVNELKQYGNLKAFICGHLHSNHGVKEIDGIKFVNAAAVVQAPGKLVASATFVATTPAPTPAEAAIAYGTLCFAICAKIFCDSGIFISLLP